MGGRRWGHEGVSGRQRYANVLEVAGYEQKDAKGNLFFAIFAAFCQLRNFEQEETEETEREEEQRERTIALWRGGLPSGWLPPPGGNTRIVVRNDTTA